MSLTITEALAEIKMLGKRIEKKREFVRTYLVRQEQFKDPLQAQGGSVETLRQERQAIRDLEGRVVQLRHAIRRANEDTTITIDGDSRSISDWLTWRREVAPGQQTFLGTLKSQLQQVRTQAVQKGLNVVADESQAKSQDVIVNVDERALATDAEHVEVVLGTLDGQLSLKNATVTIKE